MSAQGKLMCLRLPFWRKYKIAEVNPGIYRSYVADLKVNHKVKIDPKVKTALEDGTIKSPKKHPGLVTVRAVKLPKQLTRAMEAVLEKYPVKDVRGKSEDFYRYLWSRKIKQPDQNVRVRAEELKMYYFDRVKKKKDIESLSSDEKKDLLDDIEVKVKNRIHKETYNWEAVEYNAFKSLLYMLSRLPKDYSVLYQIFSEILKRDGDFRPKTMIDFGSGVGSAIWASQAVWPKSVFEYIGVDASADMNTLCRLLLQGGSESANMLYKGIHHLQYYPATHPHKFDLVVSGFSFIELGTRAERLHTLLSLWQKTEKYLVIVENGTNAGFQLVSEARDFLLQIGAEGSAPDLIGHVFAPCPHDQLCPRGLRNDGTPCNFEVTTDYLPRNLQTADKKPFRYSYVVLKKGERDTSVSSWARLVRPTSTPSKRVNCRTCTESGELERTVITAAKHGRELLRCARACRWGDLVPMVKDTEATNHGDEEIPTSFDTVTSQSGDSYLEEGGIPPEKDSSAICGNEMNDEVAPWKTSTDHQFTNIFPDREDRGSENKSICERIEETEHGQMSSGSNSQHGDNELLSEMYEMSVNAGQSCDSQAGTRTGST